MVDANRNAADPTLSGGRFNTTPDGVRPESPNGHGGGPEAFAKLGEQFAEFKEYASYLMAAKVDRVKVQIRNAVFWAVLGLIGMIAVVALVAVSATLVLIGIANGLTALFGGYAWAADLITGVVALALLAITVNVVLKGASKTFKSKLIARYEARKHHQATRFGRDVDQAAHGKAPRNG